MDKIINDIRDFLNSDKGKTVFTVLLCVAAVLLLIRAAAPKTVNLFIGGRENFYSMKKVRGTVKTGSRGRKI